MDDVWAEVSKERLDLADLLETLSPEEWDAPSLCERWRVRDVVAHIVEGAGKLSFGRTITGFVKSGFNLNKMIGNAGIEAGNEPTEDLLRKLREVATSETTPPMTKPIDMLTDAMIHTQDIRRPLNKPRQIPEDRLRIVLDAMKSQQPFVGAKKRIAGLTLTATDIEWSTGEGPEVRGPGEALLMAMVGRTSALDDLSGDGVATIRTR
jgi:uncharacterized protein (TIGR03083 family)